MKIAYITSEALPFAKTGGLADVSGSLPKSLAEDNEVYLFMPYYKKIIQNSLKKRELNLTPEKVCSFQINVDDKQYEVTGLELIYNKVHYIFIQNDELFDREGLYGRMVRDSSGQEGYRDYEDNSTRFIVFPQSVFEILKHMKIKPDVFHANDWQSALVPIYLKSLYRESFKNAISVITVHNIAFQGVFWHYDMPKTGLDWSYYTYDKLEFYGKLNFLKGGMVFADIITTVSPTYAMQIQTVEYGHGLENVLKYREKDLYGILNGIGYTEWNPETDRYTYGIHFNKDKYFAKSLIKQRFLNEMKLKKDAEIPLFGCVSRLTEQKGFDILSEIMKEFLDLPIQFVLLGTGDEKYHKIFSGYKERDNFALRLEYNNEIAHKIYAASDLFLMPSRFEPCGLGQMISMAYGTVPLVRETGGLADSVVDYINDKKKGNGFSFRDYKATELLNTIKNAVDLYNQKEDWNRLVKNTLRTDFSWENSKKEYIKLYKKYLKHK